MIAGHSCFNGDSIHSPVEHGENHQEATIETPFDRFIAER